MKHWKKLLIGSILLTGSFAALFFHGCDLFSPEDKEGDEAAKAQVLITVLNEMNKKPDCEKNNTTGVYFVNNSNTNTTYDIIWDGSKLTTVTPNNRSQTYTMAAGSHNLVFRVTNTSNNACTPSAPNLAQCTSVYYSCTG